jgi:hypothetical protein
VFLADAVAELDLAPTREAGGDDVARDVAGDVCAEPVDVRGILARQRAAALPSEAPIGVHHVLAAGQPSVTAGSADEERAAGIDQRTAAPRRASALAADRLGSSRAGQVNDLLRSRRRPTRRSAGLGDA